MSIRAIKIPAMDVPAYVIATLKPRRAKMIHVWECHQALKRTHLGTLKDPEGTYAVLRPPIGRDLVLGIDEDAIALAMLASYRDELEHTIIAFKN